jgi:branched-chain amino acid transport system permease protein
VSEFISLTVLGVVTGSIYAVAASGLVLTYTTSGVFNFAHGGIGMMAAFAYWELRVHHGWPAPLALALVVVVAAPAFGALVERFLIRNLTGEVTYMVVTIGLMLGLIGAAHTIWPADVNRQIAPFFGEADRLRVGGVNLTWHQLTTVGVAAVVAVALWVFLHHTRIGVTMRAQVDDRELIALNGARPARVATLAWALGAGLAALAGILLAPILQLNIESLTLLVVNAYAAATIGRLASLPLTYLGGILLGLVTEYAQSYLPTGTSEVARNLPLAVPTLFLFATLLLLPQGRLRTRAAVRSLATRVPSLTASVAGALALVGLVALLMATLDDAYVTRMCLALASGLVMLSLVPLTGYGGQVSLCQMTFAGVGAFAMVKLGAHGSPLALVAGAGLAAAVGALAALPALRLQGLYLALATMAFALLAQYMFFGDDRVFGQSGSAVVSRVSLPGVSFTSNRAYGMLLGVVFALAGLGVLALRRGPFGRRLAALKDSPAACATLGMSTTRVKLAVFALSAAMAGLAGGLLGGVNQTVSSGQFDMLQSLPVLLLLYVAGVGAVSGAFAGGIFLAVFFPFFSDHVSGILDVVFLTVGTVAVRALASRTRPQDGEDLAGRARQGLAVAAGAAALVAAFVFAHDNASKLQELTFLGTGLAGVSLGRSPEGAAVEIAGRLRQAAEAAGWGRAPEADSGPLPAGARALEAAGLELSEGELWAGGEPTLDGLCEPEGEPVPAGAGPTHQGALS